jgi:PKHD-type hydroxylase
LPEGSDLARELGGTVLEALSRNSTFFSAALPKRVFPPLFNRYDGGQSFDSHVDNAIRYDRSGGRAEAVRTDLSATLFLSAPDDYDGGELVIEDTFGTQQVKLAAGDLVLYPGTSLHRVLPVTRGARLASFFWIQSMVREDAQRQLMFELDLSIRRLTQALPDHPALVQLTGVYHNLLRRWAEP